MTTEAKEDDVKTGLAPEDAAKLIRLTPDPCQTSTSGGRLTCKKVWKVLEPNPDGRVEVLYIDSTDEPMTATLKGKVVLFTIEGW